MLRTVKSVYKLRLVQFVYAFYLEINRNNKYLHVEIIKFNIKLFKVMKKIFSILISFLIGAFFLFACDSDKTVENMVLQEPKEEKPIINEMRTWKEQLEYSKKKFGIENLKKRDAENLDVFLYDYTYGGIIETESELHKIKNNLFAENALSVWSNENGELDFLTIGEIKANCVKEGMQVFPDSAQKWFNNRIKLGMEYINVKWYYKGEFYKSIAVAEKDGSIVYDPIGYYLPGEIIFSDKPIVGTIVPRIMKKSEPNNPFEQRFEKNGYATNRIGVNICDFSFKCISSFHRNGILKKIDMDAKYHSGILWNADAQIRTVSGAIDESKHHTFTWACAVASSIPTCVSFSLTFSEFKFTVTGGEMAEEGTETHRVD